MSTIISRNGRHLVRIRQRGFKPVSRTFIKKSDAVAWGKKTEADMQGGRWVEDVAPVPTLAEAITEYREKIACNLKGARDYGYAFKEIEGGPLGKMPVTGLESAHLADWRDAMTARGLKPATVARQLGLLSAVMTWLVKEKGAIDSNPLTNVRRPVIRDSRARTLDPEEVRYLQRAATAARAEWLSDAIIVLMTTAVRRGELMALQCADIDFRQSLAMLHDSKNGDSRAVPCSPDACAALRRLVDAATKRGCTSLVPVEDPEAISTTFKRAVIRGRQRYEEDCMERGEVAKPGFLVNFRLHDLRHHAVSSWANTGGLSLVELMAVSGHRSPRMLARYTHMNSSMVAAKLATLSA